MRDFADAARRHFDDGTLLEQGQRLAGADHLFGLSAECALKAALKHLGAPTDAHGDLEGDVTHVDQLWRQLATAKEAQGRQGAALAGLIRIRPFEDWRIWQRYEHRRFASADGVRAHRLGAKRALDAMERVLPPSRKARP